MWDFRRAVKVFRREPNPTVRVVYQDGHALSRQVVHWMSEAHKIDVLAIEARQCMGDLHELVIYVGDGCPRGNGLVAGLQPNGQVEYWITTKTWRRIADCHLLAHACWSAAYLRQCPLPNNWCGFRSLIGMYSADNSPEEREWRDYYEELLRHFVRHGPGPALMAFVVARMDKIILEARARGAEGDGNAWLTEMFAMAQRRGITHRRLEVIRSVA